MNKLTRMLPVVVALLLVSNPAMAADGHPFDYLGMIGLGAGVAIGIAALGGGIGQGIASWGALQGIARNPNAADKIFTPMIIGLALIESLVIYALVIAFMLNGKISNLSDAMSAEVEHQQALHEQEKKQNEEK